MNKYIKKISIILCVLLCTLLSSCVSITIEYGDLNEAYKVELVYFGAEAESKYVFGYEVIRELLPEEQKDVASVISSNNTYYSEWEPISMMYHYALVFIFEKHKIFYCVGSVSFLYENGDFRSKYVATVEQYVQIMTYLGITEEWYKNYL